jgi:DNA topoisomerase-1
VKHTEKHVTREEVAQARDLGVDPTSGRPVSVRMGRYGPFVQMGTKDDVEKPRFAGLRPGQKMDAITMADAMELFKLPRDLGQTADGEPVSTNIGRFGPYIKFGAKYVSLKPPDDPYTVQLDRALELIALKKIADANRIIRDFADEGIQVLNGRYGPYITDKTRNAKIPKDRDPKTLTLEECKELLANAPVRPGRRGARGAAARPPQPAATAPAAATPPAARAKTEKPAEKEPGAAARKPKRVAKPAVARTHARKPAPQRKAAPARPRSRRKSG